MPRDHMIMIITFSLDKPGIKSDGPSYPAKMTSMSFGRSYLFRHRLLHNRLLHGWYFKKISHDLWIGCSRQELRQRHVRFLLPFGFLNYSSISVFFVLLISFSSLPIMSFFYLIPINELPFTHTVSQCFLLTSQNPTDRLFHRTL